MEGKKQVIGLTLAIVLPVFFSACGVMQNGGRELRAPNYASPVGADNWEVNCGRDVAIIDDDSLDEFYNPDGSVKTYIEFCQELEPSLIKDRRGS
jgi:hypothetical protein